MEKSSGISPHDSAFISRYTACGGLPIGIPVDFPKVSMIERQRSSLSSGVVGGFGSTAGEPLYLDRFSENWNPEQDSEAPAANV